MKNVIVVVQC